VRFWATRPLWFLLWSGVFERHPGLRYAVTECGAFWAADLLWTMDTAYDREHASKKLGDQLTATLPRRPSHYFDRNCGIGASNTRRRELARRHEIGVGNLMWGNDFPHPEGTWPHTRKWLRDAFWDIPVDDTAAILGENAATFYGFDAARLRPLADRIGPTPGDLGQRDDNADRWADVAAAGRPWLSGREAVSIPEG
jgi:predicted TIM-barrel fold metal-dependent hydrolase